MKPDQREEEKRRLGEALEAVNQTVAALFALERFYSLLREAQPRYAAVREMKEELTNLKVKLIDVSEAAARGDLTR